MKRAKQSTLAGEGRRKGRPASEGEKGNWRKRGKINGHNGVEGVIREESSGQEEDKGSKGRIKT